MKPLPLLRPPPSSLIIESFLLRTGAGKSVTRKRATFLHGTESLEKGEAIETFVTSLVKIKNNLFDS